LQPRTDRGNEDRVNGLAAADWALVNGRVLAVFGPVLILTGIGGFLIPPRFALMSGAPAYNLFHVVFGMIGTALAVAKTAAGIAAFNLVFGVIDGYQAVAGVAGWFPSRHFRYKTADHVAHVVIGLALVAVGLLGLRGLS
jgi:2-methylcitrate dehydratase PrpD